MDSIEQEITIRKLEIEDARAVSEIYSLITKTPQDSDFQKVVREHALQEGHKAHFVTELDGKVIGFMISYILPFGFGAEQNAYIATMGIHPKYMGKRIGEGMTKKILEFYQSLGIKCVYTSVRWDSTDLLSFCKTMGFERCDYINLKKNI